MAKEYAENTTKLQDTVISVLKCNTLITFPETLAAEVMAGKVNCRWLVVERSDTCIWSIPG